MTRTLLPAILGLVAIVGLSFFEGFGLKDRWGEVGIEAKELGKRFDQVPLPLGQWKGEDLPVDELVRKTAGAVNYVSRRYTHSRTGKQVVVWLIVGHSRDITRHTPNVCYPSSGFHQTGSQLRQHLELPGNKPAVFFTAKFEKEDSMSRSTERVFWAFNHPETNQWEAPKDGARWRYGLSRALYKLYFTSSVGHDEDTIEDNVSVEFAESMLPAIDEALFPTESEAAITETPTTTETEPAI